MASSQNTSEAMMARAQALIDRVQSDLASGEDQLRRLGLDPEKVRKTMLGLLTVQGRKQAQQAFQADMEAVEEEVREGAARLAFVNPAPSSARRRRPMV